MRTLVIDVVQSAFNYLDHYVAGSETVRAALQTKYYSAEGVACLLALFTRFLAT